MVWTCKSAEGLQEACGEGYKELSMAKRWAEARALVKGREEWHMGGTFDAIFLGQMWVPKKVGGGLS